MNVAYKHLDARLRIGDLTIAQWSVVLTGVAIAIVWGRYLSPFGGYLTVITAVYIGAVPAIGALLASAAEFDLLLLVRSAIAWRRAQAYYVPGAGASAQGYLVRPALHEPRDVSPSTTDLDLEALWES